MFPVATEAIWAFYRDYTLSSEMGKALVFHTDALKRERTHFKYPHTSLGRHLRVTPLFPLNSPTWGQANHVNDNCFCIWRGDSSGPLIQVPSFVEIKQVQLSLMAARPLLPEPRLFSLCWWTIMAGWCFQLSITASLLTPLPLCLDLAVLEPIESHCLS